MKLGVSITAFREPNIEGLIKHYQKYADRIVVACSSRSWYGDQDNDDTALRALKTGAIVREDNWQIEHDQRNWTMEILRDMDYVIVSHGDTFFTQQDLQTLKNTKAEKLGDLNYGCEVHTYWKDYNNVIYPYVGLPTILVRSDARFNSMVSIEEQLAEPRQLPIICHHLSWVGDELVKKKIQTYSHANEIRENWYNDVYMKWKQGDTNFAPTNPIDFQSTVNIPLPEEIQKWLKS